MAIQSSRSISRHDILYRIKFYQLVQTPLSHLKTKAVTYRSVNYALLPSLTSSSKEDQKHKTQSPDLVQKTSLLTTVLLASCGVVVLAKA